MSAQSHSTTRRRSGLSNGAANGVIAGSAIDPAAGEAKCPGDDLPLLIDPIITMNSGGIIQSASDSVERVFGWEPNELVGQNVNILIPEPRRTALDRYLDRYRNMVKTKSLEQSRRFDAVRKDGQLIQIELSMSRAELPLHGSPYFIGIVRDVSGQIDIGDDLAGDRLRLQQLIVEQTRALATANLRLQMADRLASLGTLAAGLGHDMNNVLLPVRARLNAMENAGITRAALGHLKAVRRSVGYLQDLSDGLHFLALDPEGPGIASDGEGTTDLVQWWKQVGPLLSKALPKEVTLRVSLSGKLPAVKVAPHWLTQAMLNLIVNAGEAFPKGRKGEVRIRAGVAGDGRTVRLEVSDNGRGMTASVLRKAFDLFFTTKARGMGTGLGLPLVRKVAERAGGDVEVQSSPAMGTTVILVLPVVPGRGVAGAIAKQSARMAAVTVKDHRTSAMIVQILLGAGMRIAVGRKNGPGKADVWVTRPTSAALGTTRAWLKRKRGGTVVLVGTPLKRLGSSWAKLGAKVIHPPDDFEAMRDALVEAAEPKQGQKVKEGRK